MFLVGCNYWASNAGALMWRHWDESAVERDFERLSRYGINTLRVFPNWADFQPVIPIYGYVGNLVEYRMTGETLPQNPYYLDETMLDRFETLCEIAGRYNLKLIVGLLTGWMSGRLFIPTALNDRNIFTDPTALMFQIKFIRGFVSRFKTCESVYMWDLGNECNAMSEASGRETAYTWTAVIADAIRSTDSTRPIVSGMHSLGMDSVWRIEDQAENTDILTTHPYPYFTPYCGIDKIGSIRAALHATTETQLYADIGNKPCLVEELGTLGPNICSEEQSVGFLRVNLFSNWAHGAPGVLWWCAFDQNLLTEAPYSWAMCERELGILRQDGSAKPIMGEFAAFTSWISESKIELAPKRVDAVCILTKGQDHWGIAYIANILAKQAGLTLRFCWCEQELPKADFYIMPAIRGAAVMGKDKYERLKEYVADGSLLYISSDGGMLTEFEQLVGMRIIDSRDAVKTGHFDLDTTKVEYSIKRDHIFEPRGCEVLAVDAEGNAILSKNAYGKGEVYYLNFAPESMLVERQNAFSSNIHKIYATVLKKALERRHIYSDNPFIGVTEHFHDFLKGYAVAINYSDSPQICKYVIGQEYKKDKAYYDTGITYANGDAILPPFGCEVFELRKENESCR